MGSIQGEVIRSGEVLEAQGQLWNHISQCMGSMALKCAVELGIPDAIHRHGGPISLPDLSAALSVPQSKSPELGRLMRLLTHSGIFADRSKGALVNNENDDHNSDFYEFTPISRLLVADDGVARGGLSPLLLTMLDPIMMAPLQTLATWYTSGDERTAFAAEHGCANFWDFTNRNPGFNVRFNKGMASDARFLSGIFVEECGDLFLGVRSMVDVGGGTGSTAKAVTEAFPHVRCSVLDRPRVVQTVPSDDKGDVEFIAGDMLEYYIPRADAVLLKWILHDWNDDDCVKILKLCKEAIPSREEGGKVIIIDLVIGSNGAKRKSTETQLHWDLMMMVLLGAAEREEKQWSKIFVDRRWLHRLQDNQNSRAAFGHRALPMIFFPPLSNLRISSSFLKEIME